MPNFEEFTQKAARSGDEPSVTLQKTGLFALNRPAFDALGQPESVVLLFDPKERIVGFRPAATDVPHAYSVRPQTGTRNVVVSGKAFCQKWSIGIDRAIRYPAQMLDGVLAVDLNGESEPSRPTRIEKMMAREGSSRDVTRPKQDNHDAE